jgi:hypothetical protein
MRLLEYFPRVRRPHAVAVIRPDVPVIIRLYPHATATSPACRPPILLPFENRSPARESRILIVHGYVQFPVLSMSGDCPASQPLLPARRRCGFFLPLHSSASFVRSSFGDVQHAVASVSFARRITSGYGHRRSSSSCCSCRFVVALCGDRQTAQTMKEDSETDTRSGTPPNDVRTTNRPRIRPPYPSPRSRTVASHHQVYRRRPPVPGSACRQVIYRWTASGIRKNERSSVL